MNNLTPANQLRFVAENNELLEIARKAIENVLIEWRDSRLSVMRNNGLCIRERDGTESSIIRMGSEDALSIGLKAIATHLEKQKPSATEGE